MLIVLLRRKFAMAAAVVSTGAGSISVPVASAGTVPVKVRVEAAGRALDGGTVYYTDTARLRTDNRPACEGSGRVATVRGATALGALASAARATRALRPLAVSDRYEFGITVCGIGGDFGFLKDYWLYRVNQRSPDIGADAYRVKPMDEVLWYFNQPDSMRNVGDELELRAPASVAPGSRFVVTVRRFGPAGMAQPAGGALITGGSSDVVADPSGRAALVAPGSGSLTLRATAAADIPSPPTEVCVTGGRRCPAVRGAVIVGSHTRDVIGGTRGDDRIRAGGGNDLVRTRGGGHDRVSCGPGDDRAIVDRRDVVAADCERGRRSR